MKISSGVYLDYAATTPVAPEVLEAMAPYFSEVFGNPSSLHRSGQSGMRAMDESRETLKEFVGAEYLREIIFTGSATEANNLAIFGAIKMYGHSVSNKLAHIVTTAIEHESVLEPCRVLERDGVAEVTYLKPDRDGLVSPEKVRKALRPETVLVSVGYANNEIGVIQPISEVAKVIREFKELRIKNKELGKGKPIIHNSLFIIPAFHTDAVQAAQFLDMDVKNLGVDLMTISAHKIYGPKGAGLLYVRDGIKLRPILYGGGQEYGLRPGTQNVASIVGFARSASMVVRERKTSSVMLLKMRNGLISELKKIFPSSEINGSLEHRLPNNVNICVYGLPAESAIIALSEAGICISSGAACSSRRQLPSHVIQALGKSGKDASSSLRITLGRNTKNEEIEYLLHKIFDLSKKLK